MASWVFEVPVSTDRFLGGLREQLRTRGFRCTSGSVYHLVARRWTMMLYIHVGPAPEGVLVRARTVTVPFEPTETAVGTVYEAARDAQLEILGVRR